MGRKKGKQSGNFHSKKLNAEHHHKLYVDDVSETYAYRNPVSSNTIGKGLGYRSAAVTSESAGRWDSNGRSCNGDKWSSIFANRSSTNSSSGSDGTRYNQNAARGLAHLRHLLEERRTEDRVHDRQFRLAVQRSRIREANLDYHETTKDSEEMRAELSNLKLERFEPGWIISQSIDTVGACVADFPSSNNNMNEYSSINSSGYFRNDEKSNSRIPSLQSLAAQVLGPLLPMYVAACGHDFIGDCLKSASPDILAQLSISLAKSSLESDQDEDEEVYATTDGVVKALVHSGVATGLVLKGAPLLLTGDEQLNEKGGNAGDVDTRWLTDKGLLALCPRLLPQMNVSNDAYNDDWETLDVDLDLTARMAGCFHLRRLELIDVPLCSGLAQGGITLGALRHVFQSCPGITHLGLSGCFYNWADLGVGCEATEDVSLLLFGTKAVNATTPCSSEKVVTYCQSNNQLLGQNDFNNQMSGAQGLQQLLPELQLLDLSHCSWVTPKMIFRFLLQYREKSTTKLRYNITKQHDLKSDGWNVKCTDECSEKTLQQVHSVSLKQLGLMGCQFSLADIRMIEEWICHSLSDSVKLMTNK